MPIQAVSERVGDEDAVFFRARFKRHTGTTPAESRSRFASMGLEGEPVQGREA